MDPRDRQGIRPVNRIGMFRKPLVCGFFKAGRLCRSGAQCPYAHTIPRNSNSQDCTGLDDPENVELLAKAGNLGPLKPPRDKSVKTLYIRRLNSSVNEQHLRARFSPYGEIKSIVYFVKGGANCAYLTYATREAAEKAMLELSSWVEVNGQNLKLLWGACRGPPNNHFPPKDPDTDVPRSPKPLRVYVRKRKRDNI